MDRTEIEWLLSVDGLCTDRQREILLEILATGNQRQAATNLGMGETSANNSLRRLRGKAAKLGYAKGHWEHGVASGYRMGKVTVQRNGLGEVERTWERQHPDHEVHDQIIAAVEERILRIEPSQEIEAPRAYGPPELLNQVTIADGHVGALAWHVETGSSDWDLDIARRSLLSGTRWLMDNLPAAEEILLVILGDFLDTDGYAPLTPASKHLLDVDGRFPKIASVGEEVIELSILHALTRYKRVRLLIKPGNHDPLSSWWMRRLFQRIFENNPRVIVEKSIRPYWAMRHGNVMIATHHGDKCSLQELPGVFAADFDKEWCGAKYRVCHTGHMHHKKSLVSVGSEQRGMMVYQHPTLASRNAWAAEKALIAARELIGHTYHSAGALLNTLHYNPDMMLGKR